MKPSIDEYTDRARREKEKHDTDKLFDIYRMAKRISGFLEYREGLLKMTDETSVDYLRNNKNHLIQLEDSIAKAILVEAKYLSELELPERQWL